MKKDLKYAVVFAGQGAQKPGMGKSLYEASGAARAVFDCAGTDIKYDCFEADAERLRQTEVTQPAVYTMDMAAYAALREALGLCNGDCSPDKGDDTVCHARGSENGSAAAGFPEPSAVAGFSLGEYAALTAAGVIDSLDTGLALVKKRSLLMKAAGTDAEGNQNGTMAAGMGGKDAVLALVERARGDGILEAVNFNSPQQTVVAGDIAAVGRFAALVGEDRSLGVKAIPLPVSGAFHSPLMQPAAEGLAEALEAYTFCEPSHPVYLNATGDVYEKSENEHKGDGSICVEKCGSDAEGAAEKKTGAVPSVFLGVEDATLDTTAAASAKARAVMVRQIQSPVHWQRTIEAMAQAGIEAIIEVGPGKTLTGLAKKIAPDIVALHVEDAETLAETVAALSQVERL